MLETLDWYQISWNLVLPIHVMDQVEVVHVKIESILWSHHKLKIIPHIQPTALSISQGRAVGLIHYTLGGIGCTWAFIISRILVLTS